MPLLSTGILARPKSTTVFGLRRARINLTGDYAEQFDFKIEGDFGQSDGTQSTGPAFEQQTSGLTGINLQRHRSRPASIKRRLVWSSLLPTLPCHD